MRIAVLSDTHNRLPLGVLPRIREADEIWHLGDVIKEAIITGIGMLGPKLRVVRGNCDECTDWPLFESFELVGQRIHLEHIPPRVPPAGVDLLLHGHTHIPRDEMILGTRYLNPGTAGGPTKGAPPSFAWLTLEVGCEPVWKVVLI